MIMIKDKISPDLKKRFKDEIKKSIKEGKERGFYLCLDEKGKIFSSTSSEGDVEEVNLEHIRECKGKVEGDFHVHVHISSIKKDMLLLRKEYEKEYEKELKYKLPSDEKIKYVWKKIFRRTGLTPSSPSENDLLTAAKRKCDGTTNGTACVGSDIDKDRVECWTIINEFMTKKTCDKITERYEKIGELGDSPSKLTKRLFLREVIDLKK